MRLSPFYQKPGLNNDEWIYGWDLLLLCTSLGCASCREYFMASPTLQHSPARSCLVLSCKFRLTSVLLFFPINQFPLINFPLIGFCLMRARFSILSLPFIAVKRYNWILKCIFMSVLQSKGAAEQSKHINTSSSGTGQNASRDHNRISHCELSFCA